VRRIGLKIEGVQYLEQLALFVGEVALHDGRYAFQMQSQVVRRGGFGQGSLQAGDQVLDHRVVLLQSSKRVAQIRVGCFDRREQAAILPLVVPGERGTEPAAVQQQFARRRFRELTSGGGALSDAKCRAQSLMHPAQLGRPRDEPVSFYPVPVAHVWRAFADEKRKRQWFGDGETFDRGVWAFDFRVGGRDVDEATFHGGPVSRYEAVYTDIVDQMRIVNTYDMWLDGAHMSTSIACFEFEPITGGTRLTHVEHGVFFDAFHADAAQREEGTRGLLEALADHVE
jgi:uncharacterized protein YndB with AHSA1/START domain